MAATRIDCDIHPAVGGTRTTLLDDHWKEQVVSRAIDGLDLNSYPPNMRTGQSWFDAKRVKIRTYPVVIEDGETVAKGHYVAGTFPVHIEDSYVIVEA
jgi:hypothetical protein